MSVRTVVDIHTKQVLFPSCSPSPPFLLPSLTSLKAPYIYARFSLLDMPYALSLWTNTIVSIVLQSTVNPSGSHPASLKRRLESGVRHPHCRKAILSALGKNYSES
eukprot:1354783-Amorphochlora_amoeboformis.AAC.1